MNKKIYSIILQSQIYFLIASPFLISLYFYFPFSVEDAYIVGRYVYNLINNGQLAYNIEDPISALTSPLHALLEGILYSLFKFDPVIIWKISSIFLLITTITILQRLLKENSQKLFFIISILLSSSILLWTVGGLETLLLMFLLSLAVFSFLKENLQHKNTLLKLGFLFSLIFLTRFDSAIFMLPIGLYIMWKNRYYYSHLLLFFLPIILLIGLWFTFSKIYYGHLMPSSFFQKTPGFSLSHFITTLIGLVWTGVIPIFAYSLFKLRKSNYTLKDGKIISILISLGLFLLYLFTMANKHMMFSFRSFVPYLPIIFVLLAMWNKYFTIRALIIFYISQTSHLYITYAYGINYPISEIITNQIIPKKLFDPEYAQLNIPTYLKFMEILAKQGELITKDWEKNIPKEKAIVLTYAEGIASYTGKNLFFEGFLVTRGKCKIPNYIMGLHWLDLKKDWGKISSQNAFISNKLNFWFTRKGQQIDFTVSRFKDLNKENKKAITNMVNLCNKVKIW